MRREHQLTRSMTPVPWVVGPGVMTALLAGCASPSAVAGDWSGDFRLGPVTLPVDVAVDSSGRGAKVSLRPWNLDGAAGTASAAGDSLVISIPAAKDTVLFRGALKDGQWTGRARRGADTASFTLDRLHPMTGAEWAAIQGSYRAADGRLVGVGRFAEFGERPMLIDYRSGRIGPLLALSRDRLLAGSAIVAPALPGIDVRLDWEPAGRVHALRYTADDGTAVVADRLATRDEDITFKSAAVTLAGTVTLPPGPGPFPGVVLVHGSNAQPRHTMGPWVRFFAAQGFAVLAYDKRGTGASTEDWRTADFGSLADDALAGVRALAARPDVRTHRIGLWGISQAGWIMPMAVSRAPHEVAFLVVHAGTGTTVREQGVLNYQYELRFAGLGDSAVALGTRYRELDDIVTATGKGLPAVQRFYQQHRAEATWLDEPAPVDAWFRTYYRMLIDYDPRATWEQVTCPVLLFFGELDANVPPAESWPPIAKGLAKAGNRQVTHYLLPRANHVFLEAKTGGRGEYPSLGRFVPGYFDRMAEWLVAQAR